MDEMTLYPFQQRAKKCLLEGQSVILQAPTGSGKTRAALAPFIESFFDHPPEAFPRKCIYSAPMRVLANQFVTEYGKYAEQYRRVHRRSMEVGIQTGDRPEDPKLESNLVFTTVDQTLSNFLNIPYALGAGSANLNAGAVLSSYLVFDEMHLYDPDTMLPTTLEMLRMLRGLTPFVVMTATFSSQMLSRLADVLGAIVIPEDHSARSEFEALPNQLGKERRIQAVDGPLTSKAVLDSLNTARRVICVCNTVKRAQDLYLQLQKDLTEQSNLGVDLRLLHSRFYKAHRDVKETWVRDQFGIPQSEYDGPPLILVSTQVIEVGIDATCDVLHTELAPAASTLQRAGRCARRAGENGEVFVYLPCDEDGEPDYAPYFLKSRARQMARGGRLCEGTWEAINDPDFAGRNFTFQLEQALIDRVHTPVDAEILEGIHDARMSRRDSILDAMRTREKGLGADLIRNVNTRFLFIHPNPETDEKLARNPWHYDGFSFHPGTLAKAFGDLKELDEASLLDAPWIMQTAKAVDTLDTWEERPARSLTEYLWYPLSEAREVYTSPVLAIHPVLARYDADSGIHFEPSDGTNELQRRPGKSAPPSYSYRRETFAEHASGLFRAYSHPAYERPTGVQRLALKEEIAFAVQRIEADPRFHLSTGDVDRLCRVIIACHDFGKLDAGWQAWAHDWQRRVGRFYGEDRSLPDEYMAAHTDFDPTDEQKSAQRKLGKRPPHAAESAIAAAGLLMKEWGGNEAVCRASFTAIARHHHAGTQSYQAFRCHDAARRAFEEALEALALPPSWVEEIWWQDDGKEAIDRVLVRFEASGMAEVLLYLLLIRVLRLADQRSQNV